MEAIRVLVNGAKGKMGRETVKAVSAAGDMRMVGETDLGDDLPSAIAESRAQVVVDFTHPSVCVANTEAILRSGARPVVGTTGFRPEDIQELQSLARELGTGGVIAPNFAIGAVLLIRYARDAVHYLPRAEIIELHHDRKADAPSGTAIRTAELMAAARREVPEPTPEKESVPGARGGSLQGIPIHSVRLPGYVAHQEVHLGGLGQVLVLRHDAISREAFMPGVLLAIRRSLTLSELIYGLEHLLGSS